MAEKSIPNKPLLNKIGDKYGRLTIISPAESLDKRNKTAWLCQCECGNKKVVRQSHLRSGTSTSCGCFKILNFVKSQTTHGKSHTITYGSWRAMKYRCTNPNYVNYPFYGGRGIKVCDRWLNSFENFLADMGERPSPSHEIDRTGVNGNYEPSNCQWVTRKRQARNQRNNHNIIIGDATKTLAEWAEIYKLPYSLVANRINKLKWEPLRALSTPAQTKFRPKSTDLPKPPTCPAFRSESAPAESSF